MVILGGNTYNQILEAMKTNRTNRIIKIAGNTLEIYTEPCRDYDGQFYYIRRITPSGREYMNTLYTEDNLTECSDAEIVNKYENQIEIITV